MHAARILVPAALLLLAVGGTRGLTPLGSPSQPPQPAAGDAPQAAEPLATNPRGEPLLFGPAATELRPRGTNWWAVAVSPDGKTVATAHGTGESAGEVRLWDRATGKIARTITEPRGVRCLAFSPDGKTLATGNFDNALRFYDADTGKLWAYAHDKTGGHTSGVNGLCFTRQGKLLATASLDRTVRLWDVAAVAAKRQPDAPVLFTPVAVFEGHQGNVYSVAASADGKILLSGSFDQTARVWDVPDPLPKMGEPRAVVRKERAVLKGHQAAVEAVAVSPDGSLFATGSWDAQLWTWDRDGKRAEITGAFQNGVMCVAYSADGKHLAAGSGNRDSNRPGEVRVWDVGEKKEAAYRGDFPEAVLGIAFSPDGKTVATVGDDRALHLWPFAGKDRATFTPPGLTFAPQPILAAAVSPDGRLLAFSGEAKGVYVWDRRANALLAHLDAHADVVTGLAFSPDGKTLATASHDRTVKLWDAAGWKERKTLAGHTGWVLAVAYSADGKTIATGSYDKTVRLWDAATGDAKATLKDHTAGVRSVAFSPDGKLLASAGSDRTVRVWDAAEGKVLHHLKGHKGAVRSVAFAPDGKTIATGSEDRTVKLWDAATGEERRTLGPVPDMVTSVKFSPKGQSLVVGTFVGLSSVWDPFTGRRRQLLAAHSDAVSAVLFADDGKTVLSVSHDQTIRQWAAVKPPDAAPAGEFRGPARQADAVAVTPDGRVGVLGGADGSLTTYDAVTGTPRATTAGAHAGGVTHVALSPDARLVASVGKDGKVRLWTGELKPVWDADGRFAAFAPDGKHLAVARGKDVLLLDLAAGKEARRFEGGHDGPVTCLAFHPEGKWMASAGEDTKVRLWNPATGEKGPVSPPIKSYVNIPRVEFSPDGMHLAVVANGPESPPPDDMTGEFQLIRGVYVLPLPLAEGQWLPNLPQPLMHPNDQEVTGVAWAGPNGVVTGCTDGIVRAWDPLARQIRQQFRGHDAAILAIAAAPEVAALVTAGEDHAVRRWPLPGVNAMPSFARLVGPFNGAPVWAADFDPNGKYLIAAGGGDRMLRVFAPPPTPSAAVIAGKFGAVYGSAFTPDGKLLLTGHNEGTILLWDAATGKQVGELKGHAKRVWCLALSRDGKTLVSVGGDYNRPNEPGETVVWDFAARKELKKIDGHPAQVFAVALHPDGKQFATACTDGQVRIWDTDGKLVRTMEKKHDRGTRTVAFDRDGELLASGGYDNVIRIWNARTGELVREIALPNSRPSRVLFSPDRSEVVVATRPNSGDAANENAVIYVYSLADADKSPREFRGHTGAVLNLAFLGDGKTLVSAGGKILDYGEVKVWDFATGKVLGDLVGHRLWVETLAVAPDGKTVATGGGVINRPGEVHLWNAGGFRPVAAVPTVKAQYASCTAVSPDGKTVIVGGWDQTLVVFDMADPAKPARRKQLGEHRHGLRSVLFSPDGKRFVSSDEGGRVVVWDAATLEVVRSWQAGPLPVYRARFSPDGKTVVTAAGDWKNRKPGEVRFWDTATGEEKGRLPEQVREVWDVLFLDAGRTLVTIQVQDREPKPGEATIKVWDVATKAEKRAMIPTEAPRCAAVSADGKYLALGTNFGKVKVLDTATWKEVASLAEHNRSVFRVAFAPDGRTLAAANETGSVSVLRIGDEPRR